MNKFPTPQKLLVMADKGYLAMKAEISRSVIFTDYVISKMIYARQFRHGRVSLAKEDLHLIFSNAKDFPLLEKAVRDVLVEAGYTEVHSQTHWISFDTPKESD